MISLICGLLKTNIMKQKQIHRYREQTGCCWGQRWGGEWVKQMKELKRYKIPAIK